MTRMQIVRNAALCAGLLAAASASAQEKIGKEAAAKASTKGVNNTQGFSIVLVLGDLQGGSTPDTVPPAARKALADMKDFLPYKSYKLLDTAWILGSGRATTRLHGPDEQDYELDLAAGGRLGESKILTVEFQLRERAGEATAASESSEAAARMAMLADLRARYAAIEQELRAQQELQGDRASAMAQGKTRLETVRRQIAEVESRMRRGNPIINTTFNMDIGETVVVGTSRLKGDKALIALLTAVPRGTSK